MPAEYWGRYSTLPRVEKQKRPSRVVPTGKHNRRHQALETALIGTVAPRRGLGQRALVTESFRIQRRFDVAVDPALKFAV
jgi:hypothetical protein